MTVPPNPYAGKNLVRMTLLVEGSLIVLALLLGHFNFYDHRQPLSEMPNQWSAWHGLWGLLATIPMLGYLALFHYWQPAFYEPMRKLVKNHLQPMFAGMSIAQLLLIALMAGLAEELMFRWCLQGGLFSEFETWFSWQLAVAASLLIASLVFGICHWLNAVYFLFAALTGIYFGLLMVATGTWLVPAIAHALYDFIALLYVSRAIESPEANE